MGVIIRFSHKKCGFEIDFHEGVGLKRRGKRRDIRARMSDGDWGERWQKLIKQYPDAKVRLKNVLCYCEGCNRYFGKSPILFYIPDKGCHEVTGSGTPAANAYRLLEEEALFCPDCGKAVAAMENPREIACPVCGETLRRQTVGYWD